MKNTQKGFISIAVIVWIIVGALVVGGTTYVVVNQMTSNEGNAPKDVKSGQSAGIKTDDDNDGEPAEVNFDTSSTVQTEITTHDDDVKESTVKTNIQDSRFNTYTSYKLGISVDYPKVFTYNGKQIAYSIKEEDNKLTLLLNGLTNWDGYLVSSKWDRHIEVFEKRSTETFEHAITQRFIADTPKAIYCRVRPVVPPGSDSKPKYTAYQIEYTGPTTEEIGTASSQDCSPYPQYPCISFLADEKTGKYFIPTGFCTQDMNVVSTKELGWGWWVNGVQIIE